MLYLKVDTVLQSILQTIFVTITNTLIYLLVVILFNSDGKIKLSVVSE